MSSKELSFQIRTSVSGNSRYSRHSQAYNQEKNDLNNSKQRANSFQQNQPSLEIKNSQQQPLNLYTEPYQHPEVKRPRFKVSQEGQQLQRQFTFERKSVLSTQRSIDGPQSFHVSQHYNSNASSQFQVSCSSRQQSQYRELGVVHQDQHEYMSADEVKKHQNLTERLGQRKPQKQTFEFGNLIGKRLKYYIQAIRAAVRLMNLAKPKTLKWKKIISQYIFCKEKLKYNDKINQVKIKQWCQIVFTKFITTLSTKAQYQLDFIESKVPLSSMQLDMAIHQVQNLFRMILTNLEIFTSQKYFPSELACIMYSSQFSQQRKYFNYFVSQRTKYLSNENQEISSEEKGLIFTEAVVMQQLINGLILLTDKNVIINTTIPNSEFVIRCMLTLFQYFYFQQFKNLPKNNSENYQYYIRQLGTEINKGMILVQKQQQDVPKDDFIVGLFKHEQISPLLEKRWKDQMQSIFNNIVQNLIQYEFQN